MALSQICYLSKPSLGTDLDDVLDILAIARDRNPLLQVTGLLVFRPDVFCQVLEGEAAVLEVLFEKISGDARHEDVLSFEIEPISHRRFEEWSMGYLRLVADAKDGTHEFDDAAEIDLLTADPAAIAETLRVFPRVPESHRVA